MVTNIIIALSGVACSALSSFFTWLITKKKYYTEVDHNIIDNMGDSLEFYKILSDDNRKKLEELKNENRDLRKELQEIRKQLLTLSMNICMDLSCMNRIRDTQLLIKYNDENKDRFDKTDNSSRRGCKSSK